MPGPLSRTVITALTVFLAALGLFIWGGEVLHDFSFAMLVGVVVFGCLSAIVLLQHFRHGFLADAGWPLHFERLHVWGMLAVTLVGAGAALDSD